MKQNDEIPDKTYFGIYQSSKMDLRIFFLDTSNVVIKKKPRGCKL